MRCVIKATALIGLVLLFGGCEMSPEHAIAIGTTEIARRHVPLPAGYKVAAQKDTEILEPGYIDLWDVNFSTPQGKKLYTVCVNRYNHQVEEFFDERDYRPANVSLEDFLRSRRKGR
jgi:hypothetical protein